MLCLKNSCRNGKIISAFQEIRMRFFTRKITIISSTMMCFCSSYGNRMRGRCGNLFRFPVVTVTVIFPVSGQTIRVIFLCGVCVMQSRIISETNLKRKWNGVFKSCLRCQRIWKFRGLHISSSAISSAILQIWLLKNRTGNRWLMKYGKTVSLKITANAKAHTKEISSTNGIALGTRKRVRFFLMKLLELTAR